MRPTVVGALLGLLAGSGAAIVISRLPALRQPTLADRIAPYVGDQPQRLGPLTSVGTVTPFPTLERLLRPSILAGVRTLERALGGSAGVKHRLAQSGSNLTLEQFRTEQLLWGGLGLLAGLAVTTILFAGGRTNQPLAFAIMCLLAGLGGVLLRDRALTRAVQTRKERIQWEFPTIAEMLALSITAGEGTVGALERLSRVGRGELVRELAVTLGDIRAGTPVAQALDALAMRTGVQAIDRFVDGVLVAMDRGTPLADVVRAQAADVREAHRRALIETGGKREIAMMVPVVFLILPITVIFALFPGFYGLTFISP